MICTVADRLVEKSPNCDVPKLGNASNLTLTDDVEGTCEGTMLLCNDDQCNTADDDTGFEDEVGVGAIGKGRRL